MEFTSKDYLHFLLHVTFVVILQVQDIISNIVLDVLDPPIDYIFTSQNVTLALTGNHLTGAEFTWQYVNTTAVTNVNVYEAVFTSAQIVQLEVFVKNDISNATTSITFEVQVNSFYC